jgi:Zn-dependent M28 family amino/carboxypeptidase
MTIPLLAGRLNKHVDLLAGVIGPRHLGRPGSLDAACNYIANQFKDMGDPPRHEWYSINDAQVANVVVERIGSRRKTEVVILGAHYDTVPGTPGADDNASAVAMLLEAARLLRTVSCERTLRFVAFPCEEPPHFYTGTMGSQQYARDCRARNEKIIGLICLEMVGYYSTHEGSQRTPEGIPRMFRWVFPKRGDFLAAVGNLRSIWLLWSFARGFRRATRFPLFSIALPERVREIRLSDNSSFWDQDYPALMITDTSFLRNPHYHLASDTPDTLDYARMAEATIGVAGGVAKVAKSFGGAKRGSVE